MKGEIICIGHYHLFECSQYVYVRSVLFVLIDVCIDIYVMMSSDLDGTWAPALAKSHCIYGTNFATRWHMQMHSNHSNSNVNNACAHTTLQQNLVP